MIWKQQKYAIALPSPDETISKMTEMTVGYQKGMDAEGIPGKKGIYLTGYKMNIKSIYLTGYKLLLYEHKKYLLN